MSSAVLVTGASSDIGMELIRKIGSGDDTIIGLYHKSDAGLKDLISQGAKNLIPCRCDLSNESEVIELTSMLLEKHPTLDGFVHLAAAPLSQLRYSKIDWSTIQKDLDIQLKSAHLILNRILPKMSAQGRGRIVFMLTSYTLGVPPMGLAHYTTVKYAMLGLMKALASEYKNLNINAVSPSMVDTKFLRNIPEVAVDLAKTNHPKKRIANVLDVVPTIEFLLSDKASFIHGANIPIAGGEVF